MDDFENLIIDEDDEDDEDEEEDEDVKDEDVFKADDDGLNFNFSEIAKKSDANSNNSNNGVLALVEDAGKNVFMLNFRGLFVSCSDQHSDLKLSSIYFVFNPLSTSI